MSSKKQPIRVVRLGKKPASASAAAKQRVRFPKKQFLLALLLLVIASFLLLHPYNTAKPVASVVSAKGSSTATKAATPSVCAANTDSQAIYVSISKRHLWACTTTKVVYSSPVVTGMENIAADLTPAGTYHIYAKATNLTLSGSDSTGSWNDPVSYWMPFLDNQYGTYGFHDATWRSPNEFGNVSPYSSNASHGCVECPLATAKWLYDWAPVGTTVVINS